MSFFGTRRRPPRVFRPTPSIWDRFLVAFRDYKVLSHVLVGMLATIGMLLATQSWRSRFTYRAGQIAAVGIQSRVDFEVENTRETQRLYDEAIKAAPLILVQESAVLDRLQSQFRAQLSEIANTESFESVSEGTLKAFGLNDDKISLEIRQTNFSVLKNQLLDPDETRGNRIDQLLKEFEQLIQDAYQVGLIDTESARRLLGDSADGAAPLNRSRSIKVVDETGTVLYNGTLPYVLLQDQLAETGRLGKKWNQLTNLVQLKKTVEPW
ncbi:MAG: hypothetical protein ACK58L_08825, partial [Planctomycetota bacterium]